MSHIKNLIELALSDKVIDKSETELVSALALRSGLTTSDVQRVLSRPESVEFVPPETIRERIEQLYELVLLMMVDGEIHEVELVFCKNTALKLGLSQQVIDEIVDKVIEEITSGIDSELIISTLVKSS